MRRYGYAIITVIVAASLALALTSAAASVGVRAFHGARRSELYTLLKNEAVSIAARAEAGLRVSSPAMTTPGAVSHDRYIDGPFSVDLQIRYVSGDQSLDFRVYSVICEVWEAVPFDTAPMKIKSETVCHTNY